MSKGYEISLCVIDSSSY